MFKYPSLFPALYFPVIGGSCHTNRIECVECGETFSILPELQAHIETTHTKITN